MELHAPSNVSAGEVFEVRIDLQAARDVGQLAFAVAYDKRRLALVGWSDAEFDRQWGVPAELTVQEPSDGNIEVSCTVSHGRAFAGAGNLARLEFEALEGGTSTIALRNLTATGQRGIAHANATVQRESRVTIH